MMMFTIHKNSPICLHFHSCRNIISFNSISISSSSIHNCLYVESTYTLLSLFVFTCVTRFFQREKKMFKKISRVYFLIIFVFLYTTRLLLLYFQSSCNSFILAIDNFFFIQLQQQSERRKNPRRDSSTEQQKNHLQQQPFISLSSMRALVLILLHILQTLINIFLAILSLTHSFYFSFA